MASGNQAETVKAPKVDVKDSNMGHFFVKLQDAEKEMVVEINQRIDQ